MRILAVRGCNLASLDGEFAIEFDQAPLKRAGLFAITGPTGAGKSTILDALCLALFDEMPRLPSGRGAQIGGTGEDESTSISTNDVRTILRRGTGFGWAEVDFIGIDGDPYRAKWELRRAHRRATGKYQKQDMSLVALNGGRRIGDKKGEVLKSISTLLGLTVEQFRRAVLLPQGDFASFLKAPVVERSALLELLTGTEIYSRLSIAAHERADAEKKILGELNARTDGIEVLGESDRTAMSARLSALEHALGKAELDLAQSQSMVAWLDRDAANAALVVKAAGDAENSRIAWEEAAGRRNDLASLRQLQPLKSQLGALTVAQTDRQEAEQALEQAGVTLAREQEEVQNSEAALATTREQAAKAEQNRRLHEPEIEQAHRLDDRLAHETVEQQRATNETARTVTDLNHLESERVKLAMASEHLATQLASTEKWLTDHSILAPVVAQWHRWDASLSRLGQATRDLATAHADTKAAGEAVATEKARLADLDEKLERGRLAAEKAERDLASLGEQSHSSAEELASRRKAADEQRQLLANAEKCHEEALRLKAELAALQSEHAAKLAVIEEETFSTKAKALLRDQQQLVLDEAEANLRKLHLATGESAEALRQGLVQGEPCPVCGGTDHPWAKQALVPLIDLLAEGKARVIELRASLQQLFSDIAGHEAMTAAARERTAEINGLLLARGETVHALQDRWAALVPALSALRNAVPELPTLATDWLRTAQSSLGAVIDHLASDEQLALAHRKQMDDFTAYRHKCEQAIHRLGTERAVADRAMEAARHREVMAAERIANGQQAGNSCLQELAPVFTALPGWSILVERDDGVIDSGEMDGFVKSLATQVTDYTDRNQQARQTGEEINSFARLIESKAVEIASTHKLLDSLRVRQREWDERLAGLRLERAGLLNGQAVAEVKQALHDQRMATEQALEAASAGHHSATARHAAAERDMATRQELLARLTSREIDLLGTATAMAGQHDLTLEQAIAKLAVTDVWMNAEEKALNDLAERKRETALMLAERERQQRDHGATKPAAVDHCRLHVSLFGESNAEETAVTITAEGELLTDERAIAAATVSAITASLDQARRARADMQARLASDAANRTRLAGLMAEIESQQQIYSLWAAMNQLIGSGDGRKLRNFAQSLSLDMLLVQANHYLNDLSRRYRLERIPGADLEIQVVDGDMADERRGVHSLSGGEMFLVSLALALGLSTMAVGERGSGIGTLFIDEGFGTLDPESLDLALSCLESLQASGRQVGVISHVPAMVDRIGVQVRVIPLGGGRSTVKVMQRAGRLANGEVG